MRSVERRESASNTRAAAKVQSIAKSRSPTVSRALIVGEAKPSKKLVSLRSMGNDEPEHAPDPKGSRSHRDSANPTTSAARRSCDAQAQSKNATLVGWARCRCVYAGTR